MSNRDTVPGCSPVSLCRRRCSYCHEERPSGSCTAVFASCFRRRTWRHRRTSVPRIPTHRPLREIKIIIAMLVIDKHTYKSMALCVLHNQMMAKNSAIRPRNNHTL